MIRKCLMCSKEFKSSGNHNRLCKRKRCVSNINRQILIPNTFIIHNTPKNNVSSGTRGS